MVIKLVNDWREYKAGDVLENLEDSVSKVLVETGVAEEMTDSEGIQAEMKTALAEFKNAISETLKSAISEMTQGVKQGTEPRITNVHNNADDDPKNGFKGMGEFMSTVRRACKQGTKPDDRLLVMAEAEKAATGMSEGDATDGGFLVPAEFSNVIYERVMDTPGVLQMCDTLTLQRNAITLNGMADSDRSAVATRHAGIRTYWVEEADQISSSKPAFRKISLRLQKIASLVYVTDEELEDAVINLGQRISEKVGAAIQADVTEAVMWGDGIGKPLGAFASPCVITITKETSQADATIQRENIDKIYARVWSRSIFGGQWFYNQECWPELAKLHSGIELTTSGAAARFPVFMPPGGISATPYGTLYGRPAVPTEHMLALGSAGDIGFGDFGQYLLAVKGGIKTAMSIHLRFDYEETAFRFSWRVDGRPVWDSDLTPWKGTATQSPFVILGARSS